MTDEKEIERLRDEVRRLRDGLQNIVDSFMQFDHFDGDEANAIASKILKESRARLPEIGGIRR